MKCPHCNKTIKIADRVYLNLEYYKQRSVATTECCGGLVWVVPKFSVSITPYSGDRTEDDWAVPGKPLRASIDA